MIDYLKYLNKEEQQQYKETKAAIAKIESSDSLDWDEYTKLKTSLPDLFINHFQHVSYDPREELRGMVREDIRKITKANYDELFIISGTGEKIFKETAEVLDLFFENREVIPGRSNKELLSSVTSQTKQGFIDYITLISDPAPELAYNAWATDHQQDAAVFDRLQLIVDWADEQYRNIDISQLSFIASRVDIIEYPVDKVNNTVWGLLENNTHGQVTLRAEKRGSDDELNIFYSINFDALTSFNNLKISKTLNAFDKLGYAVCGSIYNSGNEYTTATQIYYGMGNDRNKKPSASQIQKILAELKKMNKAYITLDNAEEAGKYNYKVFTYEGSLLPVEFISASVNGKTTEAVIHFLRQPPLITFAKQRKQVTPVNVRLLTAPISKTELHLKIQDYLIERISRAKNEAKREKTDDKKKTAEVKILFKTLIKKLGDKTGKQSRIKDATKIYLDHFKKEEWIKDYTIDKDGITVVFQTQ